MKKRILSILLTFAMVLSLIVSMTITVSADEEPDYLTFTGTAEFTIEVPTYYFQGTLEYSTDKENWTNIPNDSGWEVVNSENNVLYFRGEGNNNISATTIEPGDYDDIDYSQWSITPVVQDSNFRVAASGDITTILDYSDPESAQAEVCCFAHMFDGCTSLTEVPDITYVSPLECCFSYMFAGCTSLTQIPYIYDSPVEFAYYGMFEGCTSLTEAPELPATTLKSACYHSMFKGCTSLTKAPELPATTLSSYCYNFMFSDCTSLTDAPELPAKTLVEGCYAAMFKGCSSLTEAPELPATTLKSACYHSMFKGCTSLTKAPELPATTLKDTCYCYMFEGCTSLTDLPEFPVLNDTYTNSCVDMFKGCSNIKLNTSGPGKEWSIPSDSNIYKNNLGSNMFNGTGGTFTGTPVKGTTYYISSAAFPTPTFSNSVDSGYFTDETKEATYKDGVIAFTSILSNIGTDLSKWSFGASDKFGIAMFLASDTPAGSRLDVSTEATDFATLKSKQGSFYSLLINIPEEDFGTPVYAMPYAIVNGVTYWGSLMNANVADVCFGDIKNAPDVVK